MSGTRHHRKGDRTEREIGALHQALGIKAERYPLSGASRFRGSLADLICSFSGPTTATHSSSSLGACGAALRVSLGASNDRTAAGFPIAAPAKASASNARAWLAWQQSRAFAMALSARFFCPMARLAAPPMPRRAIAPLFAPWRCNTACPIETTRRALLRDPRGDPSSPLGKALDLLTESSS